MVFSLISKGRQNSIIGISVIKRLSQISPINILQIDSSKLLFICAILLFLSNCSNLPKDNKSEKPAQPYSSNDPRSDKNENSVSENIPRTKDSKQLELISLFKDFSDKRFESFKVEQYQNKSKAFPLKEIGTNASGITWDPYRQEYFVIQNNTGILYRYDRDFNFLGQVKKVGNINNDTEGVSFINGRSLMLVTEANYAHRVKMDDDTIDDGYFYGESNIQLSGRPLKKNKGFEAVAYRLSDKNRSTRVYAGQEGSGRYPEAKMRVVYYNAETESGTYSLSNGIVKIEEPFDAELAFSGVITDLAGMVFDPTGKNLIIVSQESSKIIQVNPETGEIISQLKLTGAPAYEGVTFGPTGELVLISERNLIQVYRR